MKKSDIVKSQGYYDKYIKEIEDIELNEALDKCGMDFLEKNRQKLTDLGDKVYASGKWTVKEIIQHLIDGERIFAYRALRFARNDKTELPGFEENDYAHASKANRRSIEELLNELEVVRKSTIALFNSFDDEMFQREGMGSGNTVSVLGIGFIIASHMQHHTKVIKEKYLNLK